MFASTTLLWTVYFTWRLYQKALKIIIKNIIVAIVEIKAPIDAI